VAIGYRVTQRGGNDITIIRDAKCALIVVITVVAGTVRVTDQIGYSFELAGRIRKTVEGRLIVEDVI